MIKKRLTPKGNDYRQKSAPDSSPNSTDSFFAAAGRNGSASRKEAAPSVL